MKTIIITGVLMLCIYSSHAQVLGGIFNQQDTKDKTMLQQIVLQQTYLSEIKKGYKDTENGLNTAHDLKNGTFTLHQDYFNSLSQVSPAVKNNPKIALITSYQQQIMNSFESEISWQKQQAILGGDEIGYLEKVYSNLLAGCVRDLDELNTVITPGMAQMKDAERIGHIDHIYTATCDKYQFSQSFTQNARSFALSRQSGKQESLTIKKLYNIN